MSGAILYRGHVMHMRLRPKPHRFRYRVYTTLLDIDRIDETAARLRLFSRNGGGPFSFHDRDHGPRDGGPLRPWVERLLSAHRRPTPSRIRLLSIPRQFGYAFNPLSVYFCDDSEGRPETVIYEVKNTFGDQTPYVIALRPGEATHRHEQGKEMFVSPFIGMDQTYRFTIRDPGDRLAIRIRQGDAEGDLLIATQNAVGEVMTDAALARAALTNPLAPFKIIAAIHWQALRLFLKGAPFRRYAGPNGAERPRKSGDLSHAVH